MDWLIDTPRLYCHHITRMMHLLPFASSPIIPVYGSPIIPVVHNPLADSRAHSRQHFGDR